MAAKKRILPVRRKVKHLDWIMKFVIRIHKCAICGGSLVEGYDARDPGKSITLHHTEGNREIDNWDDLDYVSNMVLCHSSCHRSYHLSKRHAEAGKNADTKTLRNMEKTIKKTLRKQKR